MAKVPPRPWVVPKAVWDALARRHGFVAAPPHPHADVLRFAHPAGHDLHITPDRFKFFAKGAGKRPTWMGDHPAFLDALLTVLGPIVKEA